MLLQAASIFYLILGFMLNFNLHWLFKCGETIEINFILPMKSLQIFVSVKVFVFPPSWELLSVTLAGHQVPCPAWASPATAAPAQATCWPRTCWPGCSSSAGWSSPSAGPCTSTLQHCRWQLWQLDIFTSTQLETKSTQVKLQCRMLNQNSQFE